MKRRAVFLDRDAVLNRAVLREGKPCPPETAELRITAGVREACRSLRDAAFLLIVITNQPDIARGSAREEVVSLVKQPATALPAPG